MRILQSLTILLLDWAFSISAKFKSTHLEGNPVAQEPNFSMPEYVAAILPNVKYYEYVAITNEQREKAKERY